MRINLPNKITIGRFLLAIVFFVLLSQYTQRAPQTWILDVSIVIFVVAALTDFFDGYIARKRGQVTALGRVLDPFADKVLVCGAFILLAGPSFVDADGRNVTEVRAWMVVVLVARELLVTGLRGCNESRGKAFAASLHGKVKMWIQSFTPPVVLLLVAHESWWPGATWPGVVKLVFVWATVIATAVSVLQYISRSRDILEDGGS